MAFQLTPLHIPSLTTDFSAQTNATARLGEMLGNLPGEMQKQRLAQQKQQILGQIGTGNLDYEKAGRSLIALGDTQAGATLLGLGQKQQERDLEKTWMGGGGVTASTAGVAPASLIQNESGGNWGASNNAVGAGGQVGHDGRAQFGRARLQEAANAGAIPQGVSREEFRKSPQLQKQAESWHFGNIDDFIQANGYDKMIGQSINGVPITVDGMRAVAHLGGNGGLRKFIETGGKYNPSDANGTSLMDYFTRHGGNSTPLAPRTQIANPVAQPQQPVQVAETEADVQRLEQEQAARAAQPVQVAGAADLPPQGTNATPAQGFAIPGEPAQQSILNDKNVQLWTQRHASAPTERTRAIAKQQLDLAVRDAEQRYAEGKTPEAVREFMWAKRNGMTEAKSPAEYAREKEKPKGPVTVSEGQRLVDPETGRVIVDAQSGAKTSREIEERTAIADRQGLQGEAREAYILNGRIPVGAEKTTEGQANAALYADRMKEAEAVFGRPGVAAAGMSRFQGGLAQVPGGNSLVSSEFQQVDQAQRNFINAALRRESGAVISEQEFDNARKQYFPQPGDGKEVLAQKARNRQTAIQGISNAAGPSYAKRQKEAAPQQFREGQRASNGKQTIVFRNGQWVPE